MLEPRETDLPALFLVLVVLPLVAYVLLGKWSETTQKKERITVLAQHAAEESLTVEAMGAASVLPIVPLPAINPIHQCARCSGPTTTRCKRCKSIYYCSGKCQIIHWREVHKHECRQLENHGSNSSLHASKDNEFHGRVTLDDGLSLKSMGDNGNPFVLEENLLEYTRRLSVSSLPSADTATVQVETSPTPSLERGSMDRRLSRRSNKGTSNRIDEHLLDCSHQESGICVSRSPTNDEFVIEKVRENIEHGAGISSGSSKGYASSKMPQEEGHMIQRQSKRAVEARKPRASSSSPSAEMSFLNSQSDSVSGANLQNKNSTSHDEVADESSLTQKASSKKNKTKTASASPGSKLHKHPKSMMKSSREQCSELDPKGDDSKNAKTKDSVPSRGSNATSSMGIMKMIGLVRPSKLERQDTSVVNTERHKKVKMLFPYEDFVKYFQHEVFNLSPRGLVNCGNSCYANAVLQCLSYTKPLTVYLLRRSHSKSCCGKDWCLMCELEQHLMMLRESGGPLLPSGILSHMRSINCQIGDGSQQDAHEFLRFLVASMQSISLEGLGGENMVDPRLQETTFIQHTFGGRLRSKVKCSRCLHESEISENMMDLTLEIFGWVESLQDALTQFTSPEDLDGENKYRCGRCATYVRARKQLRIQEAPNILTIVLKRFQEGSYGKINKCITFPDMLDMVPYMTGTDDMPPLYMLYAVIVHLDTLNASFSGHYISYIKDLQGTWYRVDDTEVKPVEMSQVMSEGAYMLFYMRSSPRPTKTGTRKISCVQRATIPKHPPARAPSTSIPEQNRSVYNWGVTHYASGLRSANASQEFSDAANFSDWSLFTSSDEGASITTDSTRDSFSTVDYSDGTHLDPISSIFGNLYPAHKTLACNMLSTSRAETRIFSEQRGSVVEGFVPGTEIYPEYQTYGYVNYGADTRSM